MAGQEVVGSCTFTCQLPVHGLAGVGGLAAAYWLADGTVGSGCPGWDEVTQCSSRDANGDGTGVAAEPPTSSVGSATVGRVALPGAALPRFPRVIQCPWP